MTIPRPEALKPPALADPDVELVARSVIAACAIHEDGGQ